MAQSSHSTSSMASIIPDEDPPNVTARNVSDQPSINTKDYEKFISDKWLADVIPTHVSLHSKDNSSDTDSTTLPFLSSTSSKALPTYSGKSSEDINEFLYKLKIFHHHPSIDNCHMDPNTNTLNFQKSINLSTLLGLYISGDDLSPLIDNPFFEDKGIEMVHHLISMKHPASQASASAVYNNMYNMKIKKSETFEAFAKWLRIHYRTCTRSGFPYEEGYLVRCFINGLDGNFDHVWTLLQNGALHWYTLTLNEVIKEAMEVKLNRQSSGVWTTDDGAANFAGKQGAKHPEQPKNPPSNVLKIDPDIPRYCYKSSDLTITEVQSLMWCYSCPLCRCNGHPLHECSFLARVYNITLKKPSSTPS